MNSDDIKEARKKAALDYHEFPSPGKLSVTATKQHWLAEKEQAHRGRGKAAQRAVHHAVAEQRRHDGQAQEEDDGARRVAEQRYVGHGRDERDRDGA